MTAQRELAFPANAPTPGTLNERVLAILRDGGWMGPWKIQQRLLERYDVMASDSCITARLRQLRTARYGSHTILKRRVADSHAYQYRMGDR